jgi:hypothetical protein
MYNTKAAFVHNESPRTNESTIATGSPTPSQDVTKLMMSLGAYIGFVGWVYNFDLGYFFLSWLTEMLLTT